MRDLPRLGLAPFFDEAAEPAPQQTVRVVASGRLELDSELDEVRRSVAEREDVDVGVVLVEQALEKPPLLGRALDNDRGSGEPLLVKNDRRCRPEPHGTLPIISRARGSATRIGGAAASHPDASDTSQT